MEMEVSCPADAAAGSLLTITAPDGAEFEVRVPAGVSPGDTFHVTPPAAASASQAPAARQYDSQILAAALKTILHALDNFDELDAFVDEHCAEFETFCKDGEHQLEWTLTHTRYVELVEAHIATELASLGCSAEDVFGYAAASQHGAGDPRVERLIERLLGLGDYDRFCAMMSENHAVMTEFGPSRVVADSSDSDDD